MPLFRRRCIPTDHRDKSITYSSKRIADFSAFDLRLERPVRKRNNAEVTRDTVILLEVVLSGDRQALSGTARDLRRPCAGAIAMSGKIGISVGENAVIDISGAECAPT